jgi:hypothetical protein
MPGTQYIYDNTVRSISGPLVAGAADAFAFYWQNPHAYKIIVNVLTVNVTAAGGTVGSVLNAGSAATAATESSNMISGADLNAIAVYLSAGGVLLDVLGGATDYITGRIKVANAAALAGTYHVEYVRAP